MNAFYLLLGSEGALADRALAKLQAEFKEESAEITTMKSPPSMHLMHWLAISQML